MEIPWLCLWTMFLLVDLSFQHKCQQCDCIVSADDASKGIHLTTLACMDGSVTWYNPIGALRIELRPERNGNFRSCFIVDSGDIKLKVSREADLSINTKSPTERTMFTLNDHNLQTLLTSEGKSNEVCIFAKNYVILYFEAEVDPRLHSQKIVFQYDSTFTSDVEKPSIEECRPCNEEEILKAYCSSDFVVVGSMESVQHHDDIGKTKIDVEVAQIIRQTGSHFSRLRRDSPLKGTILAPRKCGVTKASRRGFSKKENQEIDSATDPQCLDEAPDESVNFLAWNAGYQLLTNISLQDEMFEFLEGTGVVHEPTSTMVMYHNHPPASIALHRMDTK